MAEAWSFEHSLACPVPVEFAWRFWTDFRNHAIDEDIESIEMRGPFEPGTTGLTISRASGRVEWKIAEVEAGCSAVIEIAAPGAVLRTQWRFEDLGGSTRLTQRLSLSGEADQTMVGAVAGAFEPGVPQGMQRLCSAMTAAAASSEVVRIADQFRRAYEGPAWHGPSIVEALAGVTAEQSARRSVAGAHTIAELVAHLTAWMRIGRERLSAAEPRNAAPAEDWPQVLPPWADALAALEAEARALHRAVLAFPEERLGENAPAAEPQTFYVLLHGVVQHNTYHAGQIRMLRQCVMA